MKQIYKSWLSVLVLVVLFLVSFTITYENREFSSFCGGDYDCIVELASETTNPALCDKANNVDACYIKMTTLYNNTNLCNKAKDPNICFYQNAIITQNPSLCANINLDEDKCLFEIAIRKEDMNICNFANDSGKCFYSYAIHFKDGSICDLSEKYKSVCDEKIVGGNNTNENN